MPATQWDHGSKDDIGTSAAQLTTKTAKATSGVQLSAPAGNGGTIYVGADDGVTADSAEATNGYPIAAGGTLFLPIRNPDSIYVIADSGSDNQLFYLIV